MAAILDSNMAAILDSNISRIPDLVDNRKKLFRMHALNIMFKHYSSYRPRSQDM